MDHNISNEEQQTEMTERVDLMKMNIFLQLLAHQLYPNGEEVDQPSSEFFQKGDRRNNIIS